MGTGGSDIPVATGRGKNAAPTRNQKTTDNPPSTTSTWPVM